MHGVHPSTLSMFSRSALALLLAAGAACGGSTSQPSAVSSGGDAGDDAPGATATTPIATSANLGTYIVLGDSISDRGGQGPFFYDLLHQNDDTTYASWHGHDLATRFPGIQYVHAAVAGSITGAYGDQYTTGAPLLTDQIAALGSSYPGDVLVTVTIGGNDLDYHAPDAVVGLDTPDKQRFAANLKSALDTLTTPGRLGSGNVYVLEANIYDASDGKGDWPSGGVACPKYDVPATEDQQVFSAWNDIITQAIGAHEHDYAFDIHALFNGHGFNNANDSWYFTDCIHPNQKGHHQLRKEAWRLLTGETLSD
jgi:lysophospholipase L1-like esterase